MSSTHPPSKGRPIGTRTTTSAVGWCCSWDDRLGRQILYRIPCYLLGGRDRQRSGELAQNLQMSSNLDTGPDDDLELKRKRKPKERVQVREIARLSTHDDTQADWLVDPDTLLHQRGWMKRHYGCRMKIYLRLTTRTGINRRWMVAGGASGSADYRHNREGTR